MYWVDILSGVEKLGISLACVSIFALLIVIACSAIGFAKDASADTASSRNSEVFFTSLVFGVLGIVIGMIMAASRSSSVGEIVPAALSLIGGVALFLFAKEQGEPIRIGSAVVSFAGMLLFGTVLGSYERERALFQKSVLSIDLKQLRREADAEFAINVYRKSRGLEAISLSSEAKKSD